MSARLQASGRFRLPASSMPDRKQVYQEQPALLPALFRDPRRRNRLQPLMVQGYSASIPRGTAPSNSSRSAMPTSRELLLIGRCGLLASQEQRPVRAALGDMPTGKPAPQRPRTDARRSGRSLHGGSGAKGPHQGLGHIRVEPRPAARAHVSRAAGRRAARATRAGHH
jgi:hypothetical protein